MQRQPTKTHFVAATVESYVKADYDKPNVERQAGRQHIERKMRNND